MVGCTAWPRATSNVSSVRVSSRAGCRRMTRPDGAVAGTRSPPISAGIWSRSQITLSATSSSVTFARPARGWPRDGERRHVPGENRADDDIWRVQRDASHHGGDLAAAQRTETVSQRQLDELDPALRVLRLEGVDDLEQARRPSGGVHHADAQRAFQLQAGGRGTPECIPEGVTGRLELPEQALASLGQSRRNRRAANGPGDRGGQSSGPA